MVRMYSHTYFLGFSIILHALILKHKYGLLMIWTSILSSFFFIRMLCFPFATIIIIFMMLMIGQITGDEFQYYLNHTYDHKESYYQSNQKDDTVCFSLKTDNTNSSSSNQFRDKKFNTSHASGG